MNPAEWVQRQRLLADLNRQIKNNPLYMSPSHSGGDTQSSNNHALRTVGKRIRVVEVKGLNQQNRPHLITYDNDVDTYSSFHSEIDPYKSFTSSSRIVSEPLVDNSAQTGSFQSPNLASSSGNDNQLRPKGNTNHTSDIRNKEPLHQQQSSANSYTSSNNNNLLTGPLTDDNHNRAGLNRQDNSVGQHLRVRRDDSDDREGLEDGDDGDGVWVDDDEDDDNRQQSSDVNETAQEPEDDDGGQQSDERLMDRRAVNPPGVIGGPHGFELSPDDLTVYHG